VNRTANALVLALLSSVLAVGATPQPSEEITSKNIRQVEAKARSASDHRKIAEYYENQAKLMRAKLSDAEDLVNYWSRGGAAMAANNEAPNPYWSAKNYAHALQAEVESASAHAAEQEKLAQSAR
jgi:hypothetical protein